jgi:hypothetical protein
VAPAALKAHANLLELFALRWREDLFDLGIGSFDLTPNLRLNAAHHRVDVSVMLIDDPLHFGFLLRRQMKIAIEMLDDPVCCKSPRSVGRKETMVMQKVKAVAGDAGQQPADEDGDYRKSRGGARLTR